MQKSYTAYLKMRVLGAVDMAEGKTERARIQAVSQMTFIDEELDSPASSPGAPSPPGCAATANTASRSKGETIPHRQGQDPQGQAGRRFYEAIQTVLPKVPGRVPKRSVLHRLCIEQGQLQRTLESRRTTFYRLIREFRLLKPDIEAANKVRLAFAKAHRQRNAGRPARFTDRMSKSTARPRANPAHCFY